MEYELWGLNEHQQPICLESFIETSDEAAMDRGLKYHDERNRTIEVKKVLVQYIKAHRPLPKGIRML